MSTSGGAGGNGQPIPASSRKMVLSLKEIVGSSEAEIYAALKECNMDPNEAVNRLLSQDPFHEVKSKREKKKEGKDVTESRPRGASYSSNRGGKSGADRYSSRGTSTPYNYSESASLHGKSSTYKKENGSTPYTSSASFASGVSESNRSSGPTGFSDGASTDYRGSSWGAADVIPSATQPSHSAWSSVPGQVSMADIVKMGRPQNTPNTFLSSKIQESGVSSVHDDWPTMEKPAVLNVTPVPQSTFGSEVLEEAHPKPHFDNVNQDYADAEEHQEETLEENYDGSAVNDRESPSVSSKENLDDDFYQQRAHDFKHNEVEEHGAPVSSVTRNLQQLSLNNDDVESDEDAPTIVIPEHLQAQIADCSHLSFGSFRPGNVTSSIAFSSGNMTSAPVETEVRQSTTDVLSDTHPGSRNYEYYGDDSSRDATNDNSFHRSADVSGGSYDAASLPSQREDLKPEIADVACGNQYTFPSSNIGYSFEDAQRLNATFNKPTPETQNLASLNNIMQQQQSYTSSSPSTLLATNVHPSRESELQYQIAMAQALAAKYGNSPSNAGGSAISISEALKTANMAPPTQNLAGGANVATGSPLPQHLGLNPYSQQAHPLGPYANMMGYPFLAPQSYAYMPSAFQQNLTGNSGYQQSLPAASVHPQQYKNTGSISNLPQSGYGALGNTTTIPGNFHMNPPANSSYDDVLISQYKDLVALQQQQNENSAMWQQGSNARIPAGAVPASAFYMYQQQQQLQQQQTQQPESGFRQTRQVSQNYGAQGGYPNYYQSQAGGMGHEQQQNNQRDGGSQQQQFQNWPNSGY